MIRASHIALECRNISEPYAFFTGVLGLKPKLGFTFEGQRIAVLGAGGLDIELIEDPEAVERFASLHIAFKVRNIEAAIEAVRRQGITVIRDVYTPTKGIREALIEGPIGLVVQFVEEHPATLIWRAVKGEFRKWHDFPGDTPAEQSFVADNGDAPMPPSGAAPTNSSNGPV